MSLTASISKKKKKGLLLPVFFQKVMMIGLVVGVMMWMIFSTINSEEVSVIMRQERNDVEFWHQILKSDIFRAESETSTTTTQTDYKMYFDESKLDTARSSTGGSTALPGDISCNIPLNLSNCINFYPSKYYIKIKVGGDNWLFTNNATLSSAFDNYDYKEVIGVLTPSNPNPTIGTIYFKTELYE
ncbi:MAG: hypothetical protein KAI18_00040 [Candidatus Aenigmarchaeota archaeon]|nr:hypothetical protein [Candidatus Aenigmarchaeota archaeon]